MHRGEEDRYGACGACAETAQRHQHGADGRCPRAARSGPEPDGADDRETPPLEGSGYSSWGGTGSTTRAFGLSGTP